MKRKGIVTSWNVEKFIGTIVIHGTPTERFFLYGNRIIQGPDPVVGSEIHFDVSTKPVREGQLPHAIRVEVVDPNEKTAMEVLGGAQ